MRGFIYVNYGTSHLEHLKRSIASVKRFCDYPITVWTDKPTGIDGEQFYTPNKYKGLKDKYVGVHTVTQTRTDKILESPYSETCYLDGDIYIVDRGFLCGFDMLEKYPIMMPQNPRWFSTTENGSGDSECGANISKHDKKTIKSLPKYMTAWNAGVQFVKKCAVSRVFYKEISKLQKEGVGRDQTKIMIASWSTGFYPYVLPVHWCVCQEHAEIANPLALHCDHEPVMKRWKRDYENIS